MKPEDRVWFAIITVMVIMMWTNLNFSDWHNGARKAENPKNICREISEGEMLPFRFRIAHPEARLSDAEKIQLIEGIKRMFSTPLTK